MQQKVFTHAAAVSLVLWAIVLLLWVRSYSVMNGVVYAAHVDAQASLTRGGCSSHRLFTRSGGVHYLHENVVGSDSDRAGWTMLRSWQPPQFQVVTDRPQWQALGFSGGGRGITFVCVPFWFLALLTLCPPTVWILVEMRNRGRARNGLCPECGYDLRATPDRCPECGSAA